MTPPPQQQRRKRMPVWAMATVVVAAIVGLGGTSLQVTGVARLFSASAAYDSAAGLRNATASVLDAAISETRTAADEASTVLEATDIAADGQLQGFVGDAELEALITARDELAAVMPALETTDSPPAQLLPGDKPREADALEAEATALEEEAAAFDDRAEELEEATDAAIAASETAVDAGIALLATAPPIAQRISDENPSAANGPRIDYRFYLEELERVQGVWDQATAQTLVQFASSAVALRQSHADEEAQKAGPLYQARKDVEAFARSIAGGVLLDFDWAPIVNGFGTGGSLGGTATWNTGHGGFSTITLSDSTAELWYSDPRTQALVAHEVGHSITSKCYDLYSETFGEQDEVWATAWALGMGYTADGNGVSLYGMPSQELIEASKQCR